LAPDTYLGVVPVVKKGAGFVFEGAGEPFEYAVKMRRLPLDRLMNVLLPSDRVTPEMLNLLAAKLAGFHKDAAASPEIGVFGSLDMVKQNTDENFAQTGKYVGVSITAPQYHRIKDYTETFLTDNKFLLEERVTAGRIRDCHGDLHAAHICFSDGIEVFDCIEFNDRFRYCDVASEIAFLAMDMDRYRRADLSRQFVADYINLSGDREMGRLLQFYKCYRAYVRGKVESFKYDDPYVPPAEKEAALAAAREYFTLALRYTRRKPFLLITAGLVGSGKTTVAVGLARRAGLVVVSADVVRKKLAGIAPTERRLDEFGGGIYSPEFSRRTYDAMLEEGRRLIGEGQSVILDASFKKRADRLKAKALAEAVGADFAVIECVIDPEAARQRLERRTARNKSPSDGRWEIYGVQRADFDRIDEFTESEHIVVDTARPASAVADAVMEKLWQ
jgi:aminoglycoside phosphotransferase family enzyme/predicted kinase